jgi:hypothetical protein
VKTDENERKQGCGSCFNSTTRNRRELCKSDSSLCFHIDKITHKPLPNGKINLIYSFFSICKGNALVAEFEISRTGNFYQKKKETRSILYFSVLTLPAFQWLMHVHLWIPSCRFSKEHLSVWQDTPTNDSYRLSSDQHKNVHSSTTGYIWKYL